MRPLRFLITVLSFILAFFLLLFIGPWSSSDIQNVQDRSNVGTYFNWRTPSSLFPPSAIISLTDDNSTNFLARPAAFGPLLPVKSLSGQLWIGSGFGDDHLGRGEGELGCSDVPGWDDGSWTIVSGNTKKPSSEGKSGNAESPINASNKNKRTSGKDEDEEEVDSTEHPSEDDGTDDYLHHPLPASDGLKTNGEAAGTTKKPTHADIQSLQESAEIAGKIVLLSRGGCGFLEKVKWVQRRGGIALIVGDDIRGGPLVTMYARGDTSNVTIPSLFTSHTTAQLLSSLMPSGTLIGHAEEANRLGLVAGGKGKGNSESSGSQKNADSADKPNFTTTTAATKATSTPATRHKANSEKTVGKDSEKPKHRGWFVSLFGGSSDGADSRRPPSSGNIGWVLQEEFEDDEPVRAKSTPSSTSSSKIPTATPRRGDSDGFQIGVQDWRDPDLVAEQKEQNLRGSSTTSSSSVAVLKNSKPTTSSSLKGGSITPGSGEYGKANHEAVDIASSKKSQSKDSMTSQQTNDQQDSSRGWLGSLFSSDPPAEDAKTETAPKAVAKAPELQSHHSSKSDSYHRRPQLADGPQMHEGLWVTLSPTSMSSSPFFDTLLVLVVSPLVTLTVVYALLLLRSRIRRRRWRAPKSVVERLPVRTYQTMPSGTSSSTSSSITSQPSATTPLLPASRPINTRSRPRARTASEVPHGSSLRSDEMASPSLDQIEEKRAAGLAEWRRRYGGKQRECVVCLEEYVDGVSRVMSLPCGHEFHAECM